MMFSIYVLRYTRQNNVADVGNLMWPFTSTLDFQKMRSQTHRFLEKEVMTYYKLGHYHAI